MSFVIKHDQFEGPLDLLLSLIEKRKLFINDISLAKVTDDFINHIQRFEQFPIGESAHFILIASTLLLIKSKSLLPSLSLTEEEQGSIEDLENRLKIYQKIKDASLNIKEIFGKEILFSPSQTRKFDPVFSPDPTMTLERLTLAIRDVLKQLPKKESLPQAIVKKVISLEEMIGTLTKRIQSNLRMSFKDFSSIGKEEKVNVIVSFLAMLELVKQGIIHVNQEKAFDDIHMETKEIGVPRYY